MADTRTLKLSLLADVNKFLNGMEKAEKGTKKFETSVKTSSSKMAKSFAAIGIAAGAMAVKIGLDAVKSASDLSEEISKSNVIFGKSSKSIQAFAENADTALGLSQKEALNAASTFATLGKSAGLTGNDLTKFSKKSVTLAADLGSFYNTNADDAITAIGAALRGESEPIRKYGVLLNDATVKAKAMEMGLYDGKGALDIQAKSLATYEIILEQTKDAQGDFARTSGGLAGQQKILAAELTNLKAEMGTKLLPVMVKVTGAAIDMIGAFGGKDRDGLSERARELQGDLGNTGASSLGGSLKALADSFGNLFSALSGGMSGVDVLDTLARGLERVANGIDAIAGAVRGAKSIGGKIIDTIIMGEGKDGYGTFFPKFPTPSTATPVPRRAAGGPVMGGQPYRVGEFGPEMFVPNGSGSIRPAGNGSGVTIIMNGVVDGESARRSIEKVMQTSSRRTGAVNLNGGSL
jgi:hypothetical protein